MSTRHPLPRGLPRWVALAALLWGVGGAGYAQSQWQGIESIAETAPPAGAVSAPAYHYLVLNSGGSGGPFGQGDVREHLLDVSFLDEHFGWACGWRGVFATHDGGLTWSRVRPPGGWMRVHLSGRDEAWLYENAWGGAPGTCKLWHTDDAGATWQEQLPGQFSHLSRFTWAGDHVWALGGPGRDWRSDDDGRTWRRADFGSLLPMAGLVAVPGDAPTDAPGGWAAYACGWQRQGERVRVVRSADGGQTWAQLSLPDELLDPDWRPTVLFFATSRAGWMGGDRGKILGTEDAGATWQHRDLPSERRITALWFDQLGRGLAAVENPVHAWRATLYETSNGGRNWQPVLGGVKQVNAICGLGPGRIWAVGTVPDVVPNDLVVLISR